MKIKHALSMMFTTLKNDKLITMRNTIIILLSVIAFACEPEGYHDSVQKLEELSAVVQSNQELIQGLNANIEESFAKHKDHDKAYYDLGKFTSKNATNIKINLEYFTKLAVVVDELKKENEELKKYNALLVANVNDLSNRVTALEKK